MKRDGTPLFCEHCKTDSFLPFSADTISAVNVRCWCCGEIIHRAVASVNAILELIMGGPAESIQNIRKDSLVVTFDVTPLLKLAGGEWERVLGRVIV